MSKKHSLGKSFVYSFSGIKRSIKDEPNLRIHLLLGSLAIILGVFLSLSPLEWLILTLSIFLVIIVELINTALESLVDLVSPEIKDEAKKAKDVLAAAVLVTSLFSVLVGAILFLPKLVNVFLF